MRFFLGLGLMSAVALMGAGCATDPLSQLETVTPTFTRSQTADLQKRAKTAEALGIELHLTADAANLSGVNIIDGQQTVTVPLLKLPVDRPHEPGNRYRLPVLLATVNGKPNVRVLLDSGSNRNLFGYSLARSLNIPPVANVSPITASGIGGSVDNFLAVVPTMEIGALEFRKLVALVGPDAQVLALTRGFWGNTQVMIVGVNVLRELSYLTIDHLRGKVTLAPRGGYAPDPFATFVASVPLRWHGDLPVVDVTVDGRHTFPCILDTGGDYGMILPRDKASQLGYWKPGRGALAPSRGIGGASLATRFQVRQAQIGNAAFMSIPAHTHLIGPEPAGGQVLIGNVVLRRHRVTFDFKNNVLWLER